MNKKTYIQPILYPISTHWLYVDAIFYQERQFKIVLYNFHSKKKQTIITFHNDVIGYRCVNESYAYETIDNLLDINQDENVKPTTCIYNVVDSQYMQQLATTSSFFKNNNTYFHFLLLPVDWVIDVIATHPPLVEYEDYE